VLNTGQQIPPGTDPAPEGAGIGTAQFTLHSDGTICTNMTVNGWTGTLNNAHIHSGKVGENGPPVIQLDVDGNTATLGVWRKDCGDGVDKLTNAEIELLNKERLYVNVHTTTFGPGELRGQIFK
jgi:hypothetical protein